MPRRKPKAKPANKLIITGSSHPKMQREPKRAWTAAKEREFLSLLAETCNVTRSCEAVGMSVRGANKRRQRNAAFRAAWQEAIATAYHRLELVLLHRSFNGTEKVITRRDGSEERMREFPNQLGLSLLKMHRARTAEFDSQQELAPEAVDELRARILNKVQRLRRRREGEQARGE